MRYSDSYLTKHVIIIKDYSPLLLLTYRCQYRYLWAWIYSMWLTPYYRVYEVSTFVLVHPTLLTPLPFVSTVVPLFHSLGHVANRLFRAFLLARSTYILCSHYHWCLHMFAANIFLICDSYLAIRVPKWFMLLSCVFIIILHYFLSLLPCYHSHLTRESYPVSRLYRTEYSFISL